MKIVDENRSETKRNFTSWN